MAKFFIIFFIIFGLSFSNIPFYAFTKIIDSYIAAHNIVDKAWHLSQDNNVVDKFTSYRGLAEKIKVQQAHAAGPSFVSCGAGAGSASAITPPLPSGIATNNILLLFVETADQAITIANGSGGTWTAVLNSPQSAAATTRLSVFWSRYNGTQTAPVTSDSGDHQVGAICAYSGVITTGDPWDVTSGGTDTVSDTSGSIPGATTTGVDRLIVIAGAGNDDADTPVTTVTNADLSSISAARVNAETALGNDGGVTIFDAVKSGAGAYGATALTYTAATTKGMMTIALKPEPNASPTLTVTQPDGTGDTVTVGDLYNITYDLADPDNVVTAAMYYDTDATGLNGTAITGACATAAEGAGATCSWDTTGMTSGSYYVYGITNDGVNPQVSDYSPGQITINSPAATLTISQTAGTKISTKNSSSTDQYAHDTACNASSTCAAFTLAASGGAVNVTSIKVTESGTVTANTELSDVNLYYDTDGNWSDAGAETLFGTAATLAADQTATISGTLNISSGATAYIYVRYDLANGATYPQGGATVNWQIAASGDVVSDGTESGSGTLAGTQTVLPTADSVTYAVSPDGGRTGDSATISGKGFGAPSLDADQQDCATATVGSKGCVRFLVGGAYTVLGIDISTWNNTTITFNVSSTITTFGGASALEVVAAGQSTPTDLTYWIYPNITSITGTPVADGQREGSNVELNGTRFDTSGNQGIVDFTGGFGTVSAPIVSWADTLVTVTVPEAIADNVYFGDIRLTRNAATGSKTDLAYGADTFRILPRVSSTTPINLKGGRGDTITISGDHLCQAGPSSCPTVFSAADSVNFTGGSVTSGASTWTNTSIPSIVIPGTATDGNLNITSNTAYTSNNLTYNIKFAPTTPTNTSPSGSGISKNPTLLASAFDDGADGDSHSDSTWQITRVSGDYAAGNKVWEDTLSSAQITIDVNSTNGTFTNTDLSTELNCGTNYYWHVRYKDNGGVTSQEWSAYSSEMSFTTVSCGPDATSITNNDEGALTDGGRIGQTNIVINGSGFGTVNAGSRATCAGGAGTGCVKIGGTGGQIIADARVTAWTNTTITIQLSLTDLTTTYGGATASGSIVYAAGVSDSNGLTFYIYPDITSLTAPLGSNTGAREYDAGDTDGVVTINGNKFGSTQGSGSVTVLGQTATINSWSDTAIQVGVPTTISDSTDSGYIIVTQGTGTGGKTTNSTDAQGAINIWPRVTGISAASFSDGGFQDGTFTLNGSHFGATAGTSTVNGQTQDGSPTWGASAITGVGIPNTGTDSGSISLTRSDSKTSNNWSTFYIYPQITSYTAANGDGDIQTATTTISGNHFGTGGLASNIAINGVAPSSIGIWATGSITNVDIPNSGTDSGVIIVTNPQTSKPSNNSSNFYIYPQITSISVCDKSGFPADAGREYSASDSACPNGLKDGQIHVNGNHFGSPTSTNPLTIVGVNTSGYVSWAATLVSAAQVPTGIGDSTYLGDIVLKRSDNKSANVYGGNTFRILPRIMDFNPASPAPGDNVEIIGNHLCQAGAASCPSALNVDNKVTFYNNVDASVLNTWVNGDSATVGVNVKVPSGAQSGDVTVKSNTYNSNNFSITLASNIPNDSTSLEQSRNIGFTDIISVGGAASSTTIYFRMAMQSSVSGGTLYPEVEVKAVGTPFDGTGITEGAGIAGPGPANGTTTVSGLTTNTSYHWRARVCHNKNGTHTSVCAGTGDFPSANWVAFGSNPVGDGSTDGNPANTDFYIDATAPTISVGTPPSCDIHLNISAAGATITWSPSDAFSTTFTKQVEYATSSSLTSPSCSPGSTCGTPTSGLGSNPQTVNLTGLSSNTAYYYRVRSKDAAGNEGIFPSSAPYCSFTTSKANTKTIEYFIMGRTTVLTSAEVSPAFTVYISETGAAVQDAFVEITGVSNPIATQTVKVKLNSQAYLYYDFNASTYPTPFTILHKVAPSDLSAFSSGSSNNTLYISATGGADISVVSAKIAVTYYAPPQ